MALLSSTYGIWYYAVNAEVHMAGLALAASGIYVLGAHGQGRGGVVFGALLLVLAAGFHLTNGLLFVPACLALVWSRTQRWQRLFLFLLAYFIFLGGIYAVFAHLSGQEVIRFLASQVVGIDPYSGVPNGYWSSLGAAEQARSLRALAHAVTLSWSGWGGALAVVLVFLGSVGGVFWFGRSQRDRFWLALMLAWLLPFYLFFSVWDNGNFEFKLHVLVPATLLFSCFIHLSTKGMPFVRWTVMPVLALCLFGCNFLGGILPANDPGNNLAYQVAQGVARNTDTQAVILTGGVGSPVSVYSKIYLPYFAHRKVLVVDWVLGKGGGELGAVAHGITVLKNQGCAVYFLSELEQDGAVVGALAQRHALSAQMLVSFFRSLPRKDKVFLPDGNHLVRIN